MIDDILDDANKGMDKTLEALDIAFKELELDEQILLCWMLSK